MTDDRMTMARANELWVLSAFAVAQPLFEIATTERAFLAAHGVDAVDVVLLALALVALPPLVAWASEVVAGALGDAIALALHRFWLAGLTAAALHPALARCIDGTEAFAVGLAIAGGAGFAALHAAWAPARMLLRFLAPAPIVFAVVFLSSDAVRPLLVADRSPETASGASASIVFVLLDELPLYSLLDEDRRIDARLFPAFARLASDSVWLRNATAVDPMTHNVVPSILKGQRVGLPRKKKRESGEADLFRWLARSHRLVVHESVTSLCPRDRCEPILPPRPRAQRLEGLARDLGVLYAHWLMPTGIGATLPAVDTGWADFSGWLEPHRQRDLMEGLIARIRPDAPPTLYFAHFLVPHIPWFGLPGGATYPLPPLRASPTRSPEDWPAAVAFQRHLLQVGWLDGLLGALLDRLDETGVYDEALVVVTSDHGVAFRPGLHRRHIAKATLRDIVHVPLFVKPPGLREGRVVDRNVESIDVLATIADAIGIPAPPGSEGVSGLDASVPARPGKLVVDRKRKWKVDAGLPSSWHGLELKTRLFGPHPSWQDVWSLASAPELLGRSVPPDAATPLAGVTHQLIDPRAFDDVDPASGSIPVYVPGIVTAADPAALPDEVALAVDGVIRGVGRTFSLVRGAARDVASREGASREGASREGASREGASREGASREGAFQEGASRDGGASAGSDQAGFAILIPPSALRPGPNRVEVFAVDALRRLRRLPPVAADTPRTRAAGWPES